MYVESLKKMEGGAGNTVNYGMGSKVMWEEQHDISALQAVRKVCPVGYRLKPHTSNLKFIGEETKEQRS